MSTRSTHLVAALRAARFTCLDNAELHLAVERLLGALGVAFTRERPLGEWDRVGFFIEGGIALELEVRTGATWLLGKALRYAAHDEVREVIAASTTRHVLALPDTVQGKPLHRVQLMTLP